jgi:hypothetical protein
LFFVLEACLYLIEARIVLLILLENFGVMSKILLIWQPGFVLRALGVGRVADVIINSADIFVVDTVLDVI